MHENLKEILYDNDLQLEAYRFNGVAQAFPTHFHEYYVIGLIEEGERRLTVNGREYRIGPGDMMTFGPMDSHACEQTDGGVLRYLCLNIKPEAMQAAQPPRFAQPVQYRAAEAALFRELHGSIMGGGAALEKEELYLIFMQQLLSEYAASGQLAVEPSVRREIEEVCAFLEGHFAERITLDSLAAIANLNKYGLVRLFTREKGITPYRYLETVRIGEAKKLLEQGVGPARVAQQTGFSDQSHFSGHFSRFIGLSPGQYQAIFREGGK